MFMTGMTHPAEPPSVEPPDEAAALLAQVAAGDRQAFRALYALTAPAIYASLNRLLRQNSLADEVLQDVYVAVWQKAGGFDPRLGAGMAWLRTIARHRAIDRLRSLRREQTGLDLISRQPEQPAVTAADQAGLSWVVRRGVNALPQRQREALLLVYTAGYTQEEVAEQLGVPLGTVKSWIRRALIALKERLGAAE